MLKEMTDSGEYAELIKQWFGEEVAESLSVAKDS